ncbi:hypothetical protein AVEN_216739-1 [Araneus ventricosus]|uniref:Uncharacterized protein n=1 Tax=Araneus ventricosus TaxID=182803 RepID=A0A4Y2X4J0_ARAVE|nr:hypothetical protein AVEN_216739-1 [Araneus ventricosus]
MSIEGRCLRFLRFIREENSLTWKKSTFIFHFMSQSSSSLRCICRSVEVLGSLDVLRIAVSSTKPPQGLALFRLNPCVLAVHGDPLGTKCNPGVPLRSLWPMVLRKSGGRSEPALVNRLVVRSFGNGEVLLQVVNLNVVGQHNNSKTCSSTPTCVNCKGDHPAYAKVCPRWKEKEIQSLKTTQNLFFAEARKISDRTPKVGVSYSTATKKVMVSKYTQYEPEPTENVNVQVVSAAIQTKSVSDSNNPGKTETQSGPSANNKPQKMANRDNTTKVSQIPTSKSDQSEQPKRISKFFRETKAMKKARLASTKKNLDKKIKDSIKKRTITKQDLLKRSTIDNDNESDEISIHPSDEGMCYWWCCYCVLKSVSIQTTLHQYPAASSRNSNSH